MQRHVQLVLEDPLQLVREELVKVEAVEAFVLQGQSEALEDLAHIPQGPRVAGRRGAPLEAAAHEVVDLEDRLESDFESFKALPIQDS